MRKLPKGAGRWASVICGTNLSTRWLGQEVNHPGGSDRFTVFMKPRPSTALAWNCSPKPSFRKEFANSTAAWRLEERGVASQLRRAPGRWRGAWSHLAWQINIQFGLAPALPLSIGDLDLPWASRDSGSAQLDSAKHRRPGPEAKPGDKLSLSRSLRFPEPGSPSGPDGDPTSSGCLRNGGGHVFLLWQDNDVVHVLGQARV